MYAIRQTDTDDLFDYFQSGVITQTVSWWFGYNGKEFDQIFRSGYELIFLLLQ